MPICPCCRRPTTAAELNAYHRCEDCWADPSVQGSGGRTRPWSMGGLSYRLGWEGPVAYLGAESNRGAWAGRGRVVRREG